MATITLTLKLPFLNLNQNKVQEFERLTCLNTEVANQMLALPKAERRKLSSKDFADIEIGSAVINQTIRNANARTNAKKFHTLPLETNNQNWQLHKIGDTYSLSFSLTRGRSKRVPLAIHSANHAVQLDALLNGSAKAGSLKIKRSRKGIWYALISLSMEVPDAAVTERYVGVDRGQNHLAVASTPEGTPFFLSFKQVKHLRRSFADKRRRLQVAGKYRAVKKLEQAESRRVHHINHIISKELIQFAKKHQCGIRIEDLSGIRANTTQRAKTKSDAGKNRDYWPYYDLEQKIEYKARLAGIAFEKIPAAYTSKCCCKCHTIGERNRHLFVCTRCGYQGQADHNAAVNIGNWVGMACLVELQGGVAVMAAPVQSNGVNGAPLSSVNTQQTSAFAAG